MCRKHMWGNVATSVRTYLRAGGSYFLKKMMGSDVFRELTTCCCWGTVAPQQAGEEEEEAIARLRRRLRWVGGCRLCSAARTPPLMFN